MDTYQNPFTSLPDSDIARFNLYLRHHANLEEFANAAQLSLAEAARWLAQPFIDACLDFHTQRLLKLLTIDSLNTRQQVLALTLEGTNATNAFNSLPPPTTPEEHKTYTAKRQGVNALMRGLSILSRLISTNLASHIRQALNILTPPTTPKPTPDSLNTCKPTKVVNGIEYYEPLVPPPRPIFKPSARWDDDSEPQTLPGTPPVVTSLKRALSELDRDPHPQPASDKPSNKGRAHPPPRS